MITTESNVTRVTERGLRKIELIGKVCTKMEHTIKEDSAEKFVYNRIVDGHTAILEHEYVYFRIYCTDSVRRDFCYLSPYIRLSYNKTYIGFSYRFFTDVIGDSRRTYMNLTNVNNNITVNDMFYMMLHLTPEFSSLMFDKQDILDNIHHFNQMVVTVNRVYDEEVLKYAPEIFNVTYKITTDRGITHEFVRHKEMSFMQESTRYCNYSKNRYGNKINVIDPLFDSFEQSSEWADAMADAEVHYMELLKYGATPQMARSVLPTSTKADLYVSGTLDMWIGDSFEINTPKLKTTENKGFLPLRNSRFAHPQMIPIAQVIDEDLYNNYAVPIANIKNIKGLWKKLDSKK